MYLDDAIRAYAIKTQARLSIGNAVLDQHVYINMANQDI